MLTYKQSGVDIDEGNRAVDLIKGKIKSTYDNNVIGDLGNFSGLYSLKEFVGMEEPVLLSSTDGVGTKLRLAQMMDKHDTVGIDLVAMCVNDLICQGAKPLFFLDYIATGKLVAEKAKIVSGQNVKAGDVLIGISSSGVHSNGYSFIRKIFLDTYNYKLDQHIEELGMTLGEALLTPTKIYVKLVLDLLKRYDIKS